MKKYLCEISSLNITPEDKMAVKSKHDFAAIFYKFL